jgi:hypothetical protein
MYVADVRDRRPCRARQPLTIQSVEEYRTKTSSVCYLDEFLKTFGILATGNKHKLCF